MHTISPPLPPPPPESLPRLLREWGMPGAAPAPAAARLGAWLGWAEAIELAQLLSAAPGRAASEAARLEALHWAGAELERLQTELTAGFLHADEPPADGDAVLTAPLLAPYLQHLAQQQRLIASRITTLRARLREKLGGASAPLARLASLDEYIERALASPERRAMAGLAALLETRARKHHALDPRRWRPRLAADLQRLLRAELDQRLQPVLGLIEALNTSSP